MNRLLAADSPTEADQQRFVEAADLSLRFANTAIAASPRNPEYRALLAGIFSNYAIVGIEGALERSQTALTEAAALDPKNPSYALMEARMAASRGDTEAARTAVTKALQQKRNFTEALFLLAQLDIAEGNVLAAIDTTRTIITLEPQNPARYYQLGILHTAAEQTDEALVAYQVALTLDPGFANARYLRALLLIDLREVELALQDLRLVAETNSENAELMSLISTLESGELPVVETVSDELVDELSRSGDGAPDTDLVIPLNTVPNQQSEEVLELTPAATQEAVTTEGEASEAEETVEE
jgi:tetratricopeptide (TPR) repeat protein